MLQHEPYRINSLICVYNHKVFFACFCTHITFVGLIRNLADIPRRSRVDQTTMDQIYLVEQ